MNAMKNYESAKNFAIALRIISAILFVGYLFWGVKTIASTGIVIAGASIIITGFIYGLIFFALAFICNAIGELFLREDNKTEA